MELTQPDNVLRNLQGGSLVPWRPNRGELHEKHHSLATWRSDRRNYSPQCDGNAWTLNVTWHQPVIQNCLAARWLAVSLFCCERPDFVVLGASEGQDAMNANANQGTITVPLGLRIVALALRQRSLVF